MDEIKALDGLIIGDYNTMKLIGDTKESGGAFSGEAGVMVIDVEPEGKGRSK
jgi:hypothetical protein